MPTLASIFKPSLSSMFRPITQAGAGGGFRMLDVAGPELVVNGEFTANIDGWTDASTAGGAIEWDPAGRLSTINTSAAARARQVAPPLKIGSRYAFFVQNFSATVAGSVAVGITAGGSTILLKATNPAIAAQYATGEFAAATDALHIQLYTGVAGRSNWDGASLRELVPAQFAAGKWFEDDFARADGFLGTTTDGLLWRHMNPQNAAHVVPRIVNERLEVTANAATSTASYAFLDFGNGKVNGIMCDLSFTGAEGPGCAMVSFARTGALPVVGDITTNSVHIVFTSSYVNIQRFAAGASTVESVNYSTPLVRDGRIYQNIGWVIDGQTLTIYLPDGTSIERDATPFLPLMGSIGIPEIFFAAPVAGNMGIDRVRMRLG